MRLEQELAQLQAKLTELKLEQSRLEQRINRLEIQKAVAELFEQNTLGDDGFVPDVHFSDASEPSLQAASTQTQPHSEPTKAKTILVFKTPGRRDSRTERCLDFHVGDRVIFTPTTGKSSTSAGTGVIRSIPPGGKQATITRDTDTEKDPKGQQVRRNLDKLELIGLVDSGDDELNHARAKLFGRELYY